MIQAVGLYNKNFLDQNDSYEVISSEIRFV